MPTNKNGTTNQKKRLIWIILLCVFVVVFFLAAIWLYGILSAPELIFSSSILTVDPYETGHDRVPTSALPDDDAAGAQPAETSEPDITAGHIVNVLIMGIDLDYKSYATNGGDYHTDAMIVAAINFDKKTVDLISLSRDTFSRIPGVRGFYKLNAAINCGGGKTEQGFETCCRAAEWMLGGISVDYYCAFEMDAVIDVGNAIGGVDFDLDMTYKGVNGTSYKKGYQHLDGLGIYDYMRARKNATKNATDEGRMERQKKMLLAMFEQMKSQKLLETVPALIQSIQGKYYTNLTMQQILALANFGYRVDTDSIRTRALSGARRNVLNYVYTFTNQDNRIAVINEVYGVTVPEITNCSYDVAKWIENNGLYALRCGNIAKELRDICYLQGVDSEEQSGALDMLSLAITSFSNVYSTAEASQSGQDTADMKAALDVMKSEAERVAKLFDCEKPEWNSKLVWYKDTNVNEVLVDFR